MGIFDGSLFFIAFVIHFRTGGIIMNASASQYCHVIIGIASYQAKGWVNHMAISIAKINVASFHLLNKVNPLISAAIVGLKKVNNPMDVAGLTYGTSHPNMKPDNVPHKGPSTGAVKLENKMFDNVIMAGVPRTGYAGIHEHAKINATQVPVKATNKTFLMYF
jgi:hypothetical protein